MQVIVAGSPRSGTSIVTLWLQEMGIDMGSDAWTDGKQVHGSTERDKEMLNASEDEIAEYMQGDNWGIKNPHFEDKLDLFLKHATDPKLIITWRHPHEVLESRQRRKNLNREYVIDYYAQQYYKLMEKSQGYPTLHLFFPEIKDHSAYEKIKQFIYE